MNHVFVDFENVHHVDLSVVGSRSITFTLLLGARQTKLDVGLVEKLMEHAASVQLVRLTSSGRNALDFALAYYMGRAVAVDPAGSFHVVSRDTGFDALIEHMRSKHIHARRHVDFAALTGSAPAEVRSSASPASPEKLGTPVRTKAQPMHPEAPGTRVLDHLRKHPNSRPKRKATLARHVLALLGNKASEADVMVLIDSLRQEGHLTIDERDAVAYVL